MSPLKPRYTLFALLLIMVLGFVSRSALAIELADYVADVIDANPQVLEKLHVYRQTLQDREAAQSGWRPSVDLSGTVARTESDVLTNNSQSDDYNSNSIELAVTQNLFNGFDTENRIEQADARVKAALFDLYDTIDNISLEAVQAYLDVMKQQRLYELAQENVTSHEEILEQIRVRDSSGAGRRSELEQTEGRVARAYASMLAQRNNLEDALTQLHEILGRHLAVSEFVQPAIPQPMDSDLDASINKALKNHPALAVAYHNIEAARHDHRRAKSAFLPRLDLRLSQQISDNINDSRDNDDELTLALNLNYNLYNGGADRAERRKRVSVISEQQQFANRVRRQVINTLRLAWRADELLQKQLGYLNKHVAKSEETMLSYQEEFFVGERDLIDLLDVKNELNSAQNSYFDAFFDALAARYRIYEGVGELFAAVGIDVELDDENLRISRIAALGTDTLSDGLRMDFDADAVQDRMDHCDNSAEDQPVDQFGCTRTKGPAVYQFNTAPSAANDTLEVNLNGARSFSSAQLLANDTDAQNDVLKLTDFTQPRHGKLAKGIDGQLVYRAADGYHGKDVFSYTISDAEGATSTAEVTVFIPNYISGGDRELVNFVYGETQLTAASKGLVTQIVQHLKKNPTLALEVYAHTDSKGSESFNMTLSERRARAMRDLIVREGIDPARITVHTMGEKAPIADNVSEAGRAINRRGEFVFVEGKQ